MEIFKITFLAFFLSCHFCHGQDARIIKLPELQNMIAEKSGKIRVINFWATWCGPCVKELPYLEKITSEGRPDVTVTLVSLDLDLDPNPEKVQRFIKLKKIQSDVVMLDESNPDSWIDKIEKSWSGALPVTLIVNQKTGNRIFIDKPLLEGQLEKYLDEIQ